MQSKTMIPSFPKLLADFGRQFLWSPLTTVNTLKQHREARKSVLNHNHINGYKRIQSTFYCNEGDCVSTGGGVSVLCLSEQHTPNQKTNSSISDNINEVSVKESTDSELNDRYKHYFSLNYDTNTTTNSAVVVDLCGDNYDLPLIIESNYNSVLKRSLSEPNLLISTHESPIYDNCVGYKTIITDINSKYNFSDISESKSVTYSSKSSSISSLNSYKTSDISYTQLEEQLSLNPYNRLVEEEIDCIDTNSTSASIDTRVEGIDGQKDFVSQINNNITTELCHNLMTDEPNNDKSITSKVVIISDEDQYSLVVCQQNVNNITTEKNNTKRNDKMNRHYVNCSQICGPKTPESVQEPHKQQDNCGQSAHSFQHNLIKRQIMSGSERTVVSETENVVLNDYFDNTSATSNGFEQKGTVRLPHNRHSLTLDVSCNAPAVDSKKCSAVSSTSTRNSRRLIVSDKRLRNAVLDRLKRLGRSQSQCRPSDNKLMTTSTSQTSLSSQKFYMRTKGLYKNVKRRFSSVPPSADVVDEEPPPASSSPASTPLPPPITHTINNTNLSDDSNLAIYANQMDINVGVTGVQLRHCSSYESIEDSGCGSSIQTSSLSTDSNRSSICTGDDMNSMYSSALLRGPFIGYAKAITDCTPCPYYKDALPFKRGDIISIISKDESGTWIGMASGRVGHFKFVNVEEIKTYDTYSNNKRTASKGIKLIIPVTVEHQQQNESHRQCHKSGARNQHLFNNCYKSINNNNRDKSCDDRNCKCKEICDKLKSRLVECNGRPLTLNDIKHVINISELQFQRLFINGYNNLKLFSEISNKDRLNDCGINDAGAQHQLLTVIHVLKDYYSTTYDSESLIKPQNTSQNQQPQDRPQSKYVPKHRRDLRFSTVAGVSMSAPTTPVFTPCIDFTGDDFQQLLSKLESVSTSSLENSCAYDDIKATSVTNVMPSHRSADSILDDFTYNSEQTTNEKIYENTEQMISVTHERQHQYNSTLDISTKQQKLITNPSFITSSDVINNNSDGRSEGKGRHNSVRFCIRDKSLDRNLLRKLDLKPIYMQSMDRKVYNTKRVSFAATGMTSSQSVINLSTNQNSLLNESNNHNTATNNITTNNNNNITNNTLTDTLRSKTKFKKLISSSRKFSTFHSHSSLMSLVNSTGSTGDFGVGNDGRDVIVTDTKLCSKTLKDAIIYKLKSESIDLTDEPYSDTAGFCGIPPALIQRYTDECQRDTYEISEVLDELRMKALEAKGRRGVPNDYLGDSCMGPVIDTANYENLHLWLISLGLPMYESCLRAHGFDTLYRVSKLREVDIVNKCGVNDRRHIRILTNAIGALHLSLGELDTKI